MSEIICPYCCKRFQPTQMVFRLKHSLDDEQDRTTEEEQEKKSMWDTPGRKTGRGKVVDEKLKDYYMNFENMTANDAEENALFDAGTIDINFVDMMDDITDYNQKMYSEHQFVLELTYKGQRLTERLCPYCHNQLVPMAGLHEMKIIAMYGATHSGKTVYLNVLEAVLRGDPRLSVSDNCAFQGNMIYQGTDAELLRHNENYNLMMDKRMLPDATKSGMVVRPQVFLYRYKTADKPTEDNSILLVFRDIPGEDTLLSGSLNRYSYYLRKADGIIVMLNAQDLIQVAPKLNNSGSITDKMAVAQALANLENLLAASLGDEKISVPTAVVLAQADVLQYTLSGENQEIFSRIIQVGEKKDSHFSYFNRKIVRNLNSDVKRLLSNLGETSTILNPVDYCFANPQFFAISALGDNPETIKDETGTDIQIVQQIRPLRAAEPLYWILAKLSCIPYYHVERWRKGQNGPIKEVKFFYYEKERNGLAQKRLEDMKEKQGIKNSLFGAKWERIESNDII